MKRKNLLFLLLLALFAPWAANAQTRDVATVDFETGNISALSAVGTVTNDATYPWTIVNTKNHTDGGTYCMKSTNNGVNSSTSSIEVSVEFNEAGSVSFYCWASCESASSYYDYGIFYIDGTRMDRFLNVTDWVAKTYEVTAGSHTFKWAYTKDSSVGSNDDCFYVDDITFNGFYIPSCPKPTGLAVSNVTDNSATLNWNENGTASSWQLCVNNDEANLITTSTKPYELTGLTAQTAYTVKVRSVAGSEQSDWTDNVSFSTIAVAVAVGDSWSDDFEGASCGWDLVNGTITNAWAWGTATNNGGTHGLYVSNDNGSTNAYTTSSPAMVYATKLLTFTEGKFEFSYDWIANGESGWDFLRVVLVPSSVTLTAGTSLPSGLGSSATPSNWIALDGGSQLQGVTAWQSKSVAVNVTAGNYYLVMAWRDDTSGGTNPPAAVDNVSITKMACSYDVTNLEAGRITTTGATLVWDGGGASQWQVAYADNANFQNATEVTVSEATYSITGLTPATVYYAKVRAYCGGEDFGAWSSVLSFPTECDVIPALGYAENFDSYTGVTSGSINNLPLCWNFINTTTYSYYQGYPVVYNGSSYSHSGNNHLRFYSYAYYSGGTTSYDPQDQYAILPEMSGLAGKQITLWARGANDNSTFKIGTMSDPTDASTFVAITEQALTTSYQEFEYVIPASASGNYLAIMIDAANESRTTNGAYIDDITLTTPPTCIKPTGLEVTTSGLSATCAWVSEVGAYEIAHALEATANPDENIVGTASDTTFTMNSLALGDHYFWVRANCGGSNGNSQWVGPASVHIGYCVPNPSSRDGKGITKVIFGTGDYMVNNVDETNGLPASSPYYGDYSSMVGAMQAGTESTISITYATGSSTVYSYGTIIWVDWDNSLTFEDSEIVYTGTSVQGTGGVPQVLDATVIIPADQAIGEYRMRIAGADSYFDSYISGTATANHSACFSSTYAVCHDYTLRVLEAPTCFTPSNLAVSNITNHTADLTWTAGADETQWQICINNDEENLINVSATSYTLTNLAAETEYSVKVRANCGAEDGVSEWSDAVTFTTEVACPAPTNVAVSNIEPFNATISWNGTAENYNIRYRAASGFNYGFETAEAWTITDFSPCSIYDGDGLSTYGITDYDMPNSNYVGSVIAFSDNSQWAAHSGNTMGVFMDAIPDDEGGPTANDDYFITPELTIATGDHFTFWAKSVTDSYGLERMKVGIYGGNGTISTYFAGSADTYVEVPVDWTKYDYDLTAYVGQTIQLAINCVSEDAFALFIDDLFVGNPTDDTWDVTLNNVTSPYTLTGLTEETMYEVQVQAACGGEDGVSVWADGGIFTTPSNCAAPTNLAANDITPNAATLSWEGFHDTYNVQYRTAASRETYYFNDFNTDQEGWTYSNTIYGLADPIYNIGASANYFLAMGWNSTEEETIISCELPAYEAGAIVEFYYFAYNTANTFQVGFSTTTNDADAFTWSDPIDAPTTRYNLYQDRLGSGVKYVAFKATASSQNACVFIDDFGIFGENIPAGAWQTANVVTTPYTLTNLAHDTEYEWQVQGINASCDGGATPWSHMATFTTPDACQVPVIDSVRNIEATTATVYWTGIQESYNVRFGAFDLFSMVNFDSGEIPVQWTNDETYPWAVTDTLTDGGYCLRSMNQGVASSSASISFTATFESAGVISFDAMFMGEGTSTAWDKCIFSIDGNQKFSYGEIGEEWYNMAYSFSAGEHTFTWTYSKDSSLNPTGDFFAIDNIKVQLHNDTWTTVENVTGNSYNMTGLAPESVIAVQVQGVNDVCDGGVTEWSSEYLFITGEQTTVTQTIALNSGTSYVSFYVDITLNDLKAALVEAVPGTTIKISGQNNSTTFDPARNRWSGNLPWDVAQMYRIKVTTDCEIVLEGMPIDPAEHPVTIVTGNNYLGFPLNQSMTLTNAFSGFAENGDKISSQTNSSTYTRGRWMGNTLTELQPGQGYIYKSVADKILVFPTAKSGQRTLQKLTTKISPSFNNVNTAKIMFPSKKYNK